MNDTEWFEGRRPERQRPIILPLLIWLGIILSVILILAGLSACASVSPSPRAEVCYMQPIGRTQDGMSVVMQQCVTPEAFAEAQK